MPLSAAAAGIIGTIGTSAINAASQAMTNAHNKRMAEDAWKKEMNATREMNVYNSPSMQVARLRAAGLSPSLAYGANGEAVGNQGDIPAFNPIPAEAPMSGDLGAPFIASARLGLDTREQLNRDNLAVAELAVKSAQSFMMVTQGDLNEATKTEILSLLGYKMQDYENKFALDSATYDKIYQEIEESRSRVDLNDAEISRLNSEIKVNDATAYEIYCLLPAKLRNLDASTAMAYAQAGLCNAEVREVAEKVATLQYGRKLEHWDREFKNKQFQFDQEKWNKEYNFQKQKFSTETRVGIQNSHADRVTDVFKVIIGASLLGLPRALESASTPQPSPIGFPRP